jgi:hypothetical protein
LAACVSRSVAGKEEQGRPEPIWTAYKSGPGNSFGP